jgi:hypothetical protein
MNYLPIESGRDQKSELVLKTVPPLAAQTASRETN